MKGISLKQKGQSRYLAYEMLIVLACLFHASLFFTNTFEVSGGWSINYAELILQGKMPYRDFYYYLPPFDLIKSTILWLLSFDRILIYRFYDLLERILLWVLVFRALVKFYNRRIVFIAVIFSVFICSGDVYDMLGSYNQTMGVLEIILIIFVTKYCQVKVQKEKSKWLFLAGIILGLMFLCKQPIFLASSICFFIGLSVLSIKRKDRCYFDYCLKVVLGILIPVGITVVYLVCNKAFKPFLEQVFFNVDGKGNLYTILISNLVNKFSGDQFWEAILFFLIFYAIIEKSYLKNKCYFDKYIIVRKIKSCLKLYKNNKIVHIVLIMAGIEFLAYFVLLLYPNLLNLLTICKVFPVLWTDTTFMVYAGISLVLVVVATVIRLEEGKAQRSLYFLLYCIGLSMILFGISCNGPFRSKLYYGTYIFPAITEMFIPVLSFLCVTFIIYAYIRDYDSLFFFGIGAFSLFYAAAMGSGISDSGSFSSRIVVPLMLCVLLSIPIEKQQVRILSQTVIAVTCTVFAMVCVAQKSENSYSWWGCKESPKEDKTYEIDIPAAIGFTESKEKKEMYESITSLIVENTDENAVIMGYPYIKIFNVLTKRYNMNTFVPILFYDVSADKYIEEEYELLKENLPDVLLWKNIGNCKETHEVTFREGKILKQRRIENLFQEKIPECYGIVGYYDEVEVYCLKNENKILEVGNVDKIMDVEYFYMEDESTDSDSVYKIIVDSPLSFRTNINMVIIFDNSIDYNYISISKGGKSMDFQLTENGATLKLKVCKDLGESNYELCINHDPLKGENIYNRFVKEISVICE